MEHMGAGILEEVTAYIKASCMHAAFGISSYFKISVILCLHHFDTVSHFYFKG